MTLRQPALLVLDEGTSSCRSALFREGRLVSQSQRPVEIVFPAPGRAEQDARVLADVALEVLVEASEALEDGEPVVLGIANQRSTVVLWDAESGKPLGPALSWRDSRAVAEAEELGAAAKDLAARTGLPASPHYGAPKIAWALRHWPEARRAADAGRLRVGPVCSWILWKLTRGESFAVDPTNAQRMLLLDLATLEWAQDLRKAIQLPESALPRVLPTDGVFGEAHVGRRRIPVRGMMGDQQAVLLGLGGRGDHDAVAVQLGTGGFVLRDAGPECVVAAGLLSGLARADTNKRRRYLVEGTVNSAGSALDRLRDLGLLRDGDDLDEACESSLGPAIVVPAWAGLGAPWWSSGARAALLGWDESTRRADVIAGTVRGIAFLVADILDFMAAAGLSVKRLELSGTLSTRRSVVQAVADAAGRAVHVRDNPEATIEGIALALAEACDATPPALSIESGRDVEPRHDLSAARAAFAQARAAVMAIGRTTEPKR